MDKPLRGNGFDELARGYLLGVEHRVAVQGLDLAVELLDYGLGKTQLKPSTLSRTLIQLILEGARGGGRLSA